MGKKTKQPEVKPDYIKLRRTAYEYVVEQGKTQKETAIILGLPEKTMSEWSKEGGWRELRKTRQSAASTARENIQRLVSLLSEKRLKLEYQINEAIDAGDVDLEIRLRKEAGRISNDMSYQNKTLGELNKEKSATLGIHVDVFDDIFTALRAYDEDLFDKTIDFQTLYLRRKSNELG